MATRSVARPTTPTNRRVMRRCSGCARRWTSWPAWPEGIACMLRYLAVLLLAPWLLILGWAYFTYPKSLPRTAARRLFDGLALLLSAVAAVGCAKYGFDAAPPVQVDAFG